MAMTDPVADLLTRIRNTNSLGKETVKAPYSKLKQEILKVMEREGFIASHTVEQDGEHKKSLSVKLKYGPDGETVIRSISRVSKPGRRVFKKSADLEPVLRGTGILIVSTPQGLLSDGEARQRKVGGEVLCEVY